MAQSRSTYPQNGVSVVRMDQDLKKRAKMLVSFANTHAVGMFLPLADEVPGFQKFSANNWDFFATVGAVHSAILPLSDLAKSEQFATLMSYIRDDLAQWDDQSEAALEDCAKFVNRSIQGAVEADLDSPDLVADATGMWLLWNLYKRKPTYEESKPARIIGGSLTLPFKDWWTATD